MDVEAGEWRLCPVCMSSVPLTMLLSIQASCPFCRAALLSSTRRVTRNTNASGRIRQALAQTRLNHRPSSITSTVSQPLPIPGPPARMPAHFSIFFPWCSFPCPCLPPSLPVPSYSLAHSSFDALSLPHFFLTGSSAFVKLLSSCRTQNARQFTERLSFHRKSAGC
eukprot:1400682-Rhodomonas_salina.3